MWDGRSIRWIIWCLVALYLLASVLGVSFFAVIVGLLSIIAVLAIIRTRAPELWSLPQILKSIPFPTRIEAREIAKIRRNAGKAQRRAGYNPDGPPLSVNDIGLLIYKGETDAKIHRAMDIPTDVNYIRPFVDVSINRNDVSESRIPNVIRFNLVDQVGTLRFTARARYSPNNHFITPSTYLPLDAQNPDGKWSLQVMAGDQTLAIHEFGWLQMGGAVRAEFTGDGEISVDKRRERLEAEASDVPISLDELLADQDEKSSIEVPRLERW